MPEPFDPAEFGLTPVKAGTFDPAEFGLTPTAQPGTVNAQHPALTDDERGLIQNYAAGNPERQMAYLQKIGFETQPEGNEIKIRTPGENQWHKVEEKSGFWDNVGRLASFATPEGFRDLVDYVVTGRPISDKYLTPEGEMKDKEVQGRGEALKDLTDIGGETAVGIASAIGALPGMAVEVASPFAGPASPAAAAGGAALATGGAYATGTAMQDYLSRVGEEYGLEPSTLQESAGQGAIGALSVPVGEAAGKMIQGAPGVVGRALQKPYQVLKKTQPKIQEALNEISGKAAQDAEEAASREAAKAAKDAAAQSRMDEIAARVGSSRQAGLERSARSAGERAISASESAVRAEDQRVLSSLKQDNAKLRKILSEIEGDENKKAIMERIAGNEKTISEYSEKISQGRVKSAQSREAIAQRKASEARDAAGAPRELPTLEERTTPSQPNPESSVDRIRKAKEEAYDQAKDHEIRKYNLGTEAAQTRFDAHQAASDIGGKQAWAEAKIIADAAEKAAHEGRLDLLRESHEQVMKRLTDAGMDPDQAEVMALVIKNRAEMAAPSSPPQTSVSPETVHLMTSQMADEATRTAAKDLDLRIREAITPGLVIRAGTEGTTGAMALAGRAIEKTPDYLRNLPMGARNLLEKLTAIDIPKEKIGELNITDPSVREALDKILKRGAGSAFMERQNEKKITRAGASR